MEPTTNEHSGFYCPACESRDCKRLVADVPRTDALLDCLLRQVGSLRSMVWATYELAGVAINKGGVHIAQEDIIKIEAIPADSPSYETLLARVQELEEANTEKFKRIVELEVELNQYTGRGVATSGDAVVPAPGL